MLLFVGNIAVGELLFDAIYMIRLFLSLLWLHLGWKKFDSQEEETHTYTQKETPLKTNTLKSAHRKTYIKNICINSIVNVLVQGALVRWVPNRQREAYSLSHPEPR